MSKRKIVLIALVIIVAIPLFITTLALQNQPWTHSPAVRKTQALISTIILSNFDVVTIPDDQKPLLSPDAPFAKITSYKYGALKSRSITILTVNEIVNNNPADNVAKMKPEDSFVIAVIETLDLIGKTQTEKRVILEKVDDLALKGKIDAIVEATASDNIRINTQEAKRTERLREAGVIRCVIFDGGHHVSPLVLAPDILLIPVTHHKKTLYASHWFTRDSVPVWKLKKLLKDEAMNCFVALFPRDGLPIKNSRGMAMVSLQAIIKIMETCNDDKSKPDNSRVAQRKHALRQQRDSSNPGSKTKPIFISLKVSPEDNEITILKKLKNAIKNKQEHKERIGRVYVGLTFGVSRFPYRSKRVKASMANLHRVFRQRLPYKVMVLSEPISTWDIYLNRLGIR